MNENITTITEKVKEILADRSGKPIETITDDTDIQKDLGMDSLDFVEAIMKFEEHFRVTIPDARAEEVKTVRDAANAIAEIIQPKN